MARDRIDAVEDRLRNLERRLELVDYRLHSVEHWRAGSQAEAVPMPVPAQETVEAPATAEPPPTPPPFIAGDWQRIQERIVPVQAPAAQTQPERDTEYAIGAKLLPKLGALLVLGAILYFVAWGYNSGWITPWMVFWGEIAFCLGFIGVGQWKRNEQEQYGQILTGIGSCGLYASLAGGHLVQNLFSGEILVATFMALSLVNLAYGLWSHSKAFYAIGLLGGFSAALLPMKEDKTTLNAILHLGIVAPAALIAAKRKWADMAGALWLIGTLALFPLMAASIDWRIQVGTLYLASLGSVAAYLFAARENRFDPEGLLAPIMLFLTGLSGLALQHGRIGAVHFLILAAGSAVAAMAATAVPLHRNRVLVTAIAIPATLAPLCFTRVECLTIYLGLSLASALVALADKSRIAASFAGVEFVLAIMCYLTIQIWNPLPASSEVWLLVGLMAAGVGTAYSAVRVGGPSEPFTMGAMAVILPFFGRLGIVSLAGSSMSPSPEFAAAEALTLFALGAILVTARTRWVSAMVAMWVAFAIAALSYTYAVLFGDVPALHDAVLIGVLGLTVVIGLPIAMGTAPGDFRKTISGSAGILIGLILMRLGFVVAQMPHVGYNPILIACLTGAGYSVASSVLALARRSDPAAATAWALFAASGISYLAAPNGPVKLPIEMPIISGLLVAFVTASAALNRVARREPELWHLVALLGWVVFTRWVDVALTWSGTDLHGVQTMTVAWIVYALALLTLGFSLKAKELRYWSLGIMFTTVCKILVIDLANTSTPFRVGVLLGLGLLMLGGGYWYIKGRHTPAGIAVDAGEKRSPRPRWL
ncbi:MAG: DUF2339 domain-containing protein [Fimbriimonadales bacterium]